MIFEITKDMATKETPLNEFPQLFVDFVKDMRSRGYNDSNISLMTGALKTNIDKI